MAPVAEAQTYSATGSDHTRNGAVNSVQVGAPVDNGDTQTITERQATSTASQDRGFARVLRRAVP